MTPSAIAVILSNVMQKRNNTFLYGKYVCINFNG